MLKVVELNRKTDNVFYGMKSTLALFQNAGKGNITTQMLDNAWAEAKDDKTKRELFFALFFSIGDITARQHNIFGKDKVDSGGNAQRESFQIALQWLINNNLLQYRNFLFAGLFNEFTSFDTLLANRISTKKKTKQVTKTVSMLTGNREYLDNLSTFVANIIKGTNPTAKYFLAKFLTRPRVSKRKGHKVMLPSTKKIMRQKEFFLKLVSYKADLFYLKKDTHVEFIGYYNWRKQYIGSLESVLFSSKKILEFDKQEFLKWLEGLPAGARFRVRTRLLTKDNKPKTSKVTLKDSTPNTPVEANKWGMLPNWFLEWEKYKETKQTDVRKLEEEVRQIEGEKTRGVIMSFVEPDSLELQEKKAQLAKTKKEAKVTVGANNFQDMFKEIILGTIDKIKVQPFLDKVNLPYNTLTFIDDSSSMSSRYGNQYGFSAFDFATFLATITLMKNPDDSGRALLGFFSADARVFPTMNVSTKIVNSIIRSKALTTSAEPLIKPELHFLENLQRIREFATALRTGNGTNISAIPDYLYRWVNANDGWSNPQEKIEQLQQFPVWTIITDGNWNNMGSAEASIKNFMLKCQQYFGYKPFIIAIDAAGFSSANIDRFQDIENFMYITPNPAQIELLLTNFKDMDVMDVYTPLQSLYKSNRYNVVRQHTI